MDKQMNSFSKEQLVNKHELLKTEYIKLLNDKDVLENWGKPQLAALYNTLIGSLQIEILQLQLNIKALKRKIELVYSAINQQKIIDINEIELQVAVELAEVEFNIMNEVAKLENSKYLLNNLDSPDHSAELRKLFKQLAKQLHPDVNDDLTEDQINLWHFVKTAYENGNLEELKAIQIVYEDLLTQNGNKIIELCAEEIII